MKFMVGKSIPVGLKIQQGNQVCEVTHWLKEPGAEQVLEFEAREALALANPDRKTGLIIRAEAILELWEQLIERVEGYEAEAGDLMLCENWKSLVPPEHKLEVIARRNRFLAWTGTGSASGSPGSSAERRKNVPEKTIALPGELNQPAKDAGPELTGPEKSTIAGSDISGGSGDC